MTSSRNFCRNPKNFFWNLRRNTCRNPRRNFWRNCWTNLRSTWGSFRALLSLARNSRRISRENARSKSWINLRRNSRWNHRKTFARSPEKLLGESQKKLRNLWWQTEVRYFISDKLHHTILPGTPFIAYYRNSIWVFLQKLLLGIASQIPSEDSFTNSQITSRSSSDSSSSNSIWGFVQEFLLGILLVVGYSRNAILGVFQEFLLRIPPETHSTSFDRVFYFSFIGWFLGWLYPVLLAGCAVFTRDVTQKKHTKNTISDLRKVVSHPSCLR